VPASIIMAEKINQIRDEAPESPGSMLFRLRTARNLSLSEVAQRLKYGQRQIEALERDDFSKLPGITFVRGMIRGYAKLLGADPEVILRELNGQNFPDTELVELRTNQIPFPDGKRRTTRIYATLSALLIMIAVLIGFEISPWSFGFRTDSHIQNEEHAENTEKLNEMVATVPASAAPNASTNITETTSRDVHSLETISSGPSGISIPASTVTSGNTSGNKKIVLQFDQDSWVEIRQANGKTLLSQLNPGGSRQVVEGVPPFILIIGNAPSVHLSYNDQSVDLRPHFKVDVARLTLE